MMAQFYVVGVASFVKVSKATGESKNASHSFSRKVLAKTADDALWMVIASVRAKCCKSTRVYDVKDFVVESVDVFGKVLHRGKVA